MTSPTKTATFHYFPKLPTEIRDMIWHIALAQAHQERQILITLDVAETPRPTDTKANHCPFHRIPFDHDWKRDCHFGCVPHEHYWNPHYEAFCATEDPRFHGLGWNLRLWTWGLDFTTFPRSKGTAVRDVRLACKDADNYALLLRGNQLRRLFPDIDPSGTEAEAKHYGLAKNVSFEFDTFNVQERSPHGWNPSNVWLPSFTYHIHRLSEEISDCVLVLILMCCTLRFREEHTTMDACTRLLLDSDAVFMHRDLRLTTRTVRRSQGTPRGILYMVSRMADNPWLIVEEGQDLWGSWYVSLKKMLPYHSRKPTWTQEQRDEWIETVRSFLVDCRWKDDTNSSSEPSEVFLAGIGKGRGMA